MRQSIPEPSRVYISAVGPHGTIISGPPAIISKVLHHPDAFRHAASYGIPVYGPYHAPHLHNEHNVEEILQGNHQGSLDILSYKPALPLFSHSDGADYMASSFGELLAQVVNDILLECQNLTAITEACSNTVGEGKCEIISITPTRIASDVAASLHGKIPKGSQLVLSDLQQIRPVMHNPGIPGRDKIAIVGMSGRFPGGQDLEEFWDVLQRGLDMHKEVRPTLLTCLTFPFLTFSRYHRTVSMPKPTQIPLGKGKIKAIPPSAALLKMPVYLTPDSLTCHPVRRLRQIQCRDWL